MDKKSATSRGKKGPSFNRGREKKSGRIDEPGNDSGSWKKGQGAGSGNDNGFWKKGQGEGLTAGSKPKDGCLPKLFMLLLQFIAVGTYLVLRS
jgi:hypothetical protein